ncbi:MerR family transcriptional regulator [Bacillus sp. CGMCC 1.16607]|uniref:MerR family transcriptional regulator n=1 Tax=Bacillus sp. CGMCC 1.16607 TaxID=3351842 RepID=UPI003632F8CE
MRIGKFGEVNELSIDTIRHYMDLGLVVPEKKGGHYFFDERCQKDLEFVLEFKRMGFSLNEIKVISHYKNFGVLTQYEENAYYQSLFKEKYKKIDEEMNHLVGIKDKLKRKLDDLSTKSKGLNGSIGVDLRIIDLLKCLKCGKSLTLQDGIISRNQIMEGKLACECGEAYIIESGILIVDKPDQVNVDDPLENRILEYIHETDSAYLENLNSGLHWSKRKLSEYPLENKIILELGSGLGFFLRNIYQDLPDNCLYIAVDRSIERHLFLKSLLEKSGLNRKILFICADFLDIPIQNQCIDMVLDLSGTSNYSFEHEEFLLREVDPLIKQDSFLLASFIAFKNFSHHSKVEAKYRGNFTVNKIKTNIEDLKYRPIEDRTSEMIDKGGRYENFFVQGEEIYTYSYFGKR